MEGQQVVRLEGPCMSLEYICFPLLTFSFYQITDQNEKSGILGCIIALPKKLSLQRLGQVNYLVFSGCCSEYPPWAKRSQGDNVTVLKRGILIGGLTFISGFRYFLSLPWRICI